MSTATSVSSRDRLCQLIGSLSDEQIGVAARFIEAFAEAVQADNLDEIDLNDFRKSLNLGRLITPLTITELKGIVLPVKDKPLADRITEGGYDYVNSDITVDRFPITLDAGPRNLVLAHFGVILQSEEVKKWAADNGYELALHEDLEAVGSHPEHGELQRQLLIVQLGSSAVIAGYQRVPSLSMDDERRRLILNFDGIWDGECRFLLLRKAS